MNVRGIQYISTIDYRGHISTVIFTGGCNFRCPFCQNVDLVLNPDTLPPIDTDTIVKEIEKRKATLVDGICITGGEPLINHDIVDFIKYLKKKLHLPVKLDTNGYYPETLQKLIEDGLVNYVAMDIKTSLKKYNLAVGVDIDIERIKESINILIHLMPHYEFRTTVVPEYVTIEDMEDIANMLPVGIPLYGLQQYRPGVVISPDKVPDEPYPRHVLEEMGNIIYRKADVVEIRGLGAKVVYRKDILTKGMF